VKWEKFASCFRWSIHQQGGKYSTVLQNTYLQEQYAIRKTNTWNVLDEENFVMLHLGCSLLAKSPKRIQIALYTEYFYLILSLDVNN
jgi:hypothetical protein